MNDPLEQPVWEKPRRSLFAGLRNSFLTGIVVIAPIGLTAWFIWTFVGWIDGWVLPFVPDNIELDRILGVNIRGTGLIAFFIFAVLVGWVAKGLIGRSLLRSAEGLVQRMPVVRSIYSGVKQLAETVFAQSERSFEKACLIEYPRKGIWALGFISTEARGEVNARAGDEQLISVFLPTTPNPTSGYLLFVPKSELIELDMSIEEAAKLVISAGLVYPNGQDSAQVIDQKPAPDRS